MADSKIVVIYPRPTDVDAFEKVYAEEHVPMAGKLEGITKFVQTKAVATPSGEPASIQRIAELHFSSMDALSKAAGSQAGQDAVKHAYSISTGGAPTILICEETSTSF